MKKFIFAIGTIFGLTLAFAASTNALATFIVPQGGTGQTTFPSGNLIYGSLTAPLQSVSTTTASCSGTVSCSGFTIIGSSPVTITGSGGGSGAATTSFSGSNGIQLTTSASTINYSLINWLATSTGETDGQLAYWTTTNGNPAKLGKVATSTLQGGGPITVTAGASVIASGAITVACPTCNTSSASVTSITFGQGLGGGTITTSGTGWLLSYLSTSTSETSGQIPFWTTTNGTPAQLSGGDSNFTWSNTNKKFTATNASTTAFTVGGSLYIPTTASLPALNQNQVAINTTAASSSVEFGSSALYATTSVSFSWSTTTPSTAATDTVMIITGARGQKLDNMACGVIGGTATVAIGNGSATTTYYQAKALSTTPVPTTLSSNNTFDEFSRIFIAIGTYSANTISNVSCGFGREYTY